MSESIEKTSRNLIRKLDLLENAVKNAKRHLLAGNDPTDDFGNTFGKTILTAEVTGAKLNALIEAEREQGTEDDIIRTAVLNGAEAGGIR